MDGGTSVGESATGEVASESGGMASDGMKAVSVSMTYDADNRLLTYNGQAVEYDAEGNMTKGPLNGGMAEFTYDCRNRLVKVKEADGTVTTYEYDAENVRTAKVAGGVRTEYTTDRESTYSQVLVKKEYEKNAFGLYTEQKAQTVYTYGTGLVSERRNGGEEFYYHYNHLGSTMAVSDKGGNVVYRFVYDTYGELSDVQNGNKVSLKTAEEASEYTLAELADAAGIEYLYNGRYGVTTDSNSLYYMRARYYNQDIKRFINRDVLSGDITNSQSLNRYCYVQGNPVSLTDPFGLCPTEEEILKIELRRALHTTLDVLGIVFDVADLINAGLYVAEGNYGDAIWSVIFLLPCVGSIIGLPFKYAFKLGGNAAEGLAKFTKKYAPELAENGGRLIRNAGGKLDDAWKWIQRKLGKEVLEDSTDTVIYRRVQGGNGNNASQVRIKVNADGTIGISNKDANLSISIDNGEHAEYFLNKRGGDAQIVEVEVPKWFDDFLQENAIPQTNYKMNPLNQGGTAPKITDITTSGNCYELPAPWIEWLEEYGKNARIVN